MGIEKVWHPYWDWEDYGAGMWRSVGSARERSWHLARAIEFTGNAKLYGSFMMRVIREWPIACEHHLTDGSINRRAWIGHAATCLAIQCPEDITRSAWGHLNQKQQDDANAEADDAIRTWESTYIEGKTVRICLKVATTRIPRRDSRRSGSKAGGAEQGSILPASLQGHFEKRPGLSQLGLFENSL